MPISPRAAPPRASWTAILGLAFGSASYQALPPHSRVDARLGVVRAGNPEEARRVADALDELLPAVIDELPDARAATLEIWVQEEPALYVFPASTAYRDADGFFSERLGRIHLRASSDDVERTLVHELVHASLGASWSKFPGTLEEGLCDVVAARLCPRSAPRLRAGRLLAAALAIGGLDIEIQFAAADGSDGAAAELSFVQRILPPEGSTSDLDPLDVFRMRAGVSSAALAGDRKKALYGLAFLVAERVVDRHGVEGLHEILGATRPKEMEAALLAAADLTSDPEDWRRALAAALGPAEMLEISRHHPGFLLAPSSRFPDPGNRPEDGLLALDEPSDRPQP